MSMTTGEGLVLMVNQMMKYKKNPEKFKKEMLEMMIQDKDYTAEEKQALKEELSKMKSE